MFGSSISKAINQLCVNFVSKQDSQWWLMAIVFIFASFATMRSSVDLQEMKKLPEATKVNKRFSHFFFAFFILMWILEDEKKDPKVCFLMPREVEKKWISNNYKNKHFFHLWDVLKSDTCITATRTLQSNSREKSLEMQHEMLRISSGRQKASRRNSRVNATICFMYRVMILVSRVLLFSGVRCRRMFSTGIELQCLNFQQEINKMQRGQSAKVRNRTHFVTFYGQLNPAIYSFTPTVTTCLSIAVN